MGSAVTSASTTQSLTLPAPAKLNLFLHVTGRRADGYHLLESVFVPINLADTIRLTRRSDGVVRLVDPPPGLDEQNELCCRAARALQAATGCALGVDIQVSKRIPQGAGLGGGSSDAATTLLGLNQLWGLGQSREALQQVAASLGADVPFFVFGRPALARGVGERLLAVTMRERCRKASAILFLRMANTQVFSAERPPKERWFLSAPASASCTASSARSGSLS